VTRSLAGRLISLLLALVAGFGPATQALAHGHAHEHLAGAHQAAPDHAAHHAGTSARVHAPAHAAPKIAATQREATGDGDADDHAHPRVGASVVARGDLRLDLAAVVVAAPPAGALTLPAVQSVAARLLTAAPPRASPAPGPPLPGRAPPLG